MKIDFSKLDGLVPVVVQHHQTRHVLMVGFMNEEAYSLTQSSGKVTFYSRTRKTVWTKGETSGNFLEVREVLIDCDEDTLLIKAEPRGPTCHTGSDTCFGETVAEGVLFLERLAGLVSERKKSPKLGSYTSSIFESGIDRAAQKVGEEAIEVVIESKNDNPQRLIGEASDLLFHLTVLLEAKGVSIIDVVYTLADRHKIARS